MNYAAIEKFHGHSCPGLAIGYRMASAGLDALHAIRAEDEELVAIVENDACGVDALQILTGCTFGKGNLLFHDYGKPIYTIYSRPSRQGVRVLFHGHGVPEGIREERATFTKWLLSTTQENIVSVTPVFTPPPEPARIMESTTCNECREPVMKSRIINTAGKDVCIPCYKTNHYE